MRFLALSLLGLSLLGQSKDTLNQRYGAPVAETFVVRPGIVATVTYGRAGRVTELVIAPRIATLIKSRGKTLSHDLIQELVDELVPKESRGTFVIGSFINMACLPANDCRGSSESYEKVTIFYSSQEGGVSYAVVQWID